MIDKLSNSSRKQKCRSEFYKSKPYLVEVFFLLLMTTRNKNLTSRTETQNSC